MSNRYKIISMKDMQQTSAASSIEQVYSTSAINSMGFAQASSLNNYETIADAANKLYTSAAFTKTSADTLYAPIGTSATINNLSATYVPLTIIVSAGNGLTGGGSLSANQTISLPNVGTAGTYFAIVTDVYGRVTSGMATITSGNIPTLAYLPLSGGTLTGNLSGTTIGLTSAINIGVVAFPDINIYGSFTGNISGYSQVIVQNTSNAANASSDYIVTNDQSTSSSFYGDLGINSSQFSGSGSLNLPNAVYLYSSNGDLVLATSTSGTALHLLTSGALVDALTITSANKLNIPSATASQFLKTDASKNVVTALITSADVPALNYQPVGTYITSAQTSSTYVPLTRTVTATSGLTGGGALSANITVGLIATGTSGTYVKVVTDVYGRVTSGTSALTSADIPSIFLTKTSADTLYAPISTSATINNLSATYSTIVSVSALSADEQNKLYTSAAFTKTSADSLYAPISTSATINNLSATYETLSDAANKLYTSAAFTKTSADTLYAPIGTSATINNLSATYATIASVSAVSASVATKLTTVTTNGTTLSGAGTAGSPLGLSAQGTAGTYDMVVVDQYGRVTSGGPSSASGGGGGATPKYASVIPIAACTSTQTFSTGASNNFFVYGERFVLDFDMAFTTNSTMQYCAINASGNMCMGVYKIVPGSAYQLMFGSSATFSATNGPSDAPVGIVVSGTLFAGVPYSMVIMHSMNSPTFLGLSNTSTNIAPFISWTKSNAGTVTSALATITPENEATLRFFAGLKV